MRRKIITLTTDFATDLYVGQIKGVILSINPEIKLIDLTHKIKSFNILNAAFFIWQVCPLFPEAVIHLVVVDPGVGSKRTALIIRTEKHLYIGPNNGIFHFIEEEQKIKEVIQINPDKFKNSSTTFQARDIFAPIASFLSLGRKIEEFGWRVSKKVIKKLNLPDRCILYIDDFGNIITNIREDFSPGERLKVIYKRKKIEAIFARTFSEVKEGSYVVLKGSSGYLEIDKNKASAAKSLGAKTGDRINILR